MEKLSRQRTRQTKIVFTIGPATMEKPMLRKLIEEGVDICRINMAHADHEWTRMIVRRVRETCEEVGRHIAIMMDVKGPEIRTGKLEGDPIQLTEGEIFDFTVEKDPEGGVEGYRSVDVNYPGLLHDIKVGDTVLVDSGLLRLKVLEIREDRARCKVLIPGELGSRRHINLPGVHVKLPALTEKDKGDIRVGIEMGIEFFALSFAREADDLDIFYRFLSDHGSKARIIAKIEDQQAIQNLDEIIKASNGLMVARGDLGIECPYEELPILQHRAVKTCIREGRPVIVATHMLESMISAPVPTRAEVSDVSTAVIEQADAIMLSGETTIGKYPLECIRVFKRIAERMEQQHTGEPNRELRLRTPKGKLLRSSAYLARELDDAGIILFTRSGYLAQMLSSLRAKSPVFAFTDDPLLFKQMLLLWGIEPFMLDFNANDPEQTIRDAFDRLSQTGWAKRGETVIVVSNVLAGEKVIDTIQIRSIE
ncbi:MAG: pyruvate kinase [Verrucomicrobiota bacterium]